eukprot:TRINITY_DN56272_c0_g1_i1.p1 TRINITY_DN56272_c0_g1~~TRINITY_DN56272_c0_g1_i1.p1  ORF type:complete len:330 (-),score=31.78 TRINITY_DN56272_c0_g1_i1:129-1118(-)
MARRSVTKAFVEVLSVFCVGSRLAFVDPYENQIHVVTDPAQSVDILLVRHGQSEGNVFPWQGPFSPTDPRLTDAGRAQASEAGVALAALPKPSFVFTSCLLRAMETALLAWPDASVVHIAPFISEERWDQDFFYPASQPSLRESQKASVLTDLGESALDRLSYDWAPETQEECGPPDWNKFLDWVWNQTEVSSVVKEFVSQGGLPARPRFAIVSHGNFLDSLFKTVSGFPKTHPRNMEVVAATLGIRLDENDKPVGFAQLTFINIPFGGFRGGPILFYWVFALSLLFCVFCGYCACFCFYCCCDGHRRSYVDRGPYFTEQHHHYHQHNS